MGQGYPISVTICRCRLEICHDRTFVVKWKLLKIIAFKIIQNPYCLKLRDLQLLPIIIHVCLREFKFPVNIIIKYHNIYIQLVTVKVVRPAYVFAFMLLLLSLCFEQDEVHLHTYDIGSYGEWYEWERSH